MDLYGDLPSLKKNIKDESWAPQAVKSSDGNTVKPKNNSSLKVKVNSPSDSAPPGIQSPNATTATSSSSFNRAALAFKPRQASQIAPRAPRPVSLPILSPRPPAPQSLPVISSVSSGAIESKPSPMQFSPFSPELKKEEFQENMKENSTSFVGFSKGFEPVSPNEEFIESKKGEDAETVENEENEENEYDANEENEEENDGESGFDVSDVYEPHRPNDYLLVLERREEEVRRLRQEAENEERMRELARVRRAGEERRALALQRGDLAAVRQMEREGAGRGRAVSNLPAWVTQSTDEEEKEVEKAKEVRMEEEEGRSFERDERGDLKKKKFEDASENVSVGEKMMTAFGFKNNSNASSSKPVANIEEIMNNVRRIASGVNLK